MKRVIPILVWFAALGVVLWIIWAIGMALECEYPYALTLARVRSAKSVNGVPIANVIKGDGAAWGHALPWHTCSYCAQSIGRCKGVTQVHLIAPDGKTIYYFAFSGARNQIVPMTDQTANHFPLLLPEGDYLEPIGKLDGTGRTLSVGAGSFMLPAKWYTSLRHPVGVVTSNAVPR